jgi:hypothetical protein
VRARYPRRLNLFPPDKLAKVLEGVGAAIDAMGGSLTMSYATVAATAARGQGPVQGGPALPARPCVVECGL